MSCVTVRCVPRVLGGKGPYNAPLFNLLILREQKMGGLKIIGFLKLSLLFALIEPRGKRGRRERRAFMMSRRLCVSPGSMSFQ